MQVPRYIVERIISNGKESHKIKVSTPQGSLDNFYDNFSLDVDHNISSLCTMADMRIADGVGGCCSCDCWRHANRCLGE